MSQAAKAAPAIVHVTLAAVLADLFPGAPRHLEIPANDIGAMIDVLDAQWPGMGDRIRDSRPAIRKHMNIFVDGERAALETALPDGADVFIVTAISGG